MKKTHFHDEPFDPATLIKLEVVERYAEEWLPVFLSRENPPCTSIHVFDFFAGPGTDSVGEWGSPLRLLRQLNSYRQHPGWGKVSKHVHFYDEDAELVSRLERNLDEKQLRIEGVRFDVACQDFQHAFAANRAVFEDGSAAKLAFVDQFGVSEVRDDVFRAFARSPRCDLLFFISSSTLNRFADDPAIKQKIVRPTDSHHVHRAACDYYRSLIPPGLQYFVAPFSIKKGTNVYGLVFGTRHPLGVDKFLRVTWKNDAITGEANFDIDRDDIVKGQKHFDFKKPRKTDIFEAELEAAIRSGSVSSERDVMIICYAHGVERHHSTSVLAKLKREGVISLAFRTPDVNKWGSPRPITLIKR